MNDSTIYEVSNSEGTVILPELWPGWETVRILGKGSFGAVYEIKRESMGITEHAALKVISFPKDSSEITALQSSGMDAESITSWFDECVHDVIKEYAVMKELRGHTNIVYCDDFNTIKHANGMGWDIYIKMELLTPLTDVVNKRPLSEEEIVKLGADIAQALVVCKNYNIVHRDIKPQNIFISKDGDYKLGDFGIATMAEHTTSMVTAGTYKYMAPEVFRNDPYGPKADIYSLGLVLHWLLNERRSPFEPLPPQPVKKSDSDTARNLRFNGKKIPAPLHGSEELKNIVSKAIEFSSKNRYQSAQEMLDALKNIGKTDTPPPRIPWKLIAGAAVAVAAIAILVSAFKPSEVQDTSVVSKPPIADTFVSSPTSPPAPTAQQTIVNTPTPTVQQTTISTPIPTVAISNAPPSWKIVDDVLIIEGNGKMHDYDGDLPPWRDKHRDNVSLVRVDVEQGITHIGDQAFQFCSGIEFALIADSVESIGEAAFYGCSSLEEVGMPYSLDKIGGSAFAKCSKLESIKIPRGVKTIENAAFNLCEEMQWVFIPKSVKTIEDSAFNGCSSLTTVYYEGSKEDWEKIEIAAYNRGLNNAEIVYDWYM